MSRTVITPRLSAPFILVLLLFASQGIIASPTGKRYQTPSLALTIKPTNTTSLLHSFDNYRLELTYPRIARFPLDPTGVFACIAAAASTARYHGPDERLPTSGFQVAKDGVWLEAFPYRPDYTWALMVTTLRQVEGEMRTRGWFRCSWEIEKMGNPGSPGRLVGWGRMWPSGEPGKAES